MKSSVCSTILLLVALLAVSAFAAEDDALAPVFVFGRTGGCMMSGFAVGDGSYVVTSIDAASEQLATGKSLTISSAAVVSRWTGEVYPAKIVATDGVAKLALLKLPVAAIPPVTIAGEEAFKRVANATLGQLMSGEEVGGRFSASIYAIEASQNPAKFTTGTWKSSVACLTEMRNGTWFFLSRVDRQDRLPKTALVAKPGVGALGVYINRLIVGQDPNPATFYQVLPYDMLNAFLSKAHVHPAESSTIGAQASDAEESYQALCLALSASMHGSPKLRELAETAVKLRPKNATAQMLLATALAQQGKFDEALKAVDAALAIDPTLPDARLQRGAILDGAGKLDLAEQEYRTAIKCDSKDSRPMVALAELLLAKDEQLDDALKLARNAVLACSSDPSTHIVLARVLKRQKSYDEAVSELKNLLDCLPGWAQLHSALGDTYSAAGKMDLAEAEYKKLVELDPKNPGAQFILIDFLISQNKQDDARSQIEKAKQLKLQPVEEEALKQLESKLNSGSKK